MTSSLELATDLLDGSLPVRVHSVRAAAWVTRSALEDILRNLIRNAGLEPGMANTRSLLGCIEVLYQDDAPDVAPSAQYAWDALSQAAHHHAYMFPPTHAEVAALTRLVTELNALAIARTPRGPRAAPVGQSSFEV